MHERLTMLAAVGCALSLSLPSVAAAALVVIDFDDLAAGTVVTDQYADRGVVFSIDNHATAQAVIIEDIPGSQVNPSSPNALSNDVDPALMPVQIIRATFVDPGDGVTPTTTDMVSFRYTSDQPDFGRLEAYSALDQLLASAVSVEPGFQVSETLSVSASGIAYVLIHPETDVWVDDFTFSVVPLPAAAWLFVSALAGVLGLGVVRN